VVVPTCADGPGENHATGIDSLPDAFEVDDACDLLDEYWCKSFPSQLLVDAKEVDLGAVHDRVAYSDFDGDGRNEGAKGVAASNADMPMLLPTRRHQGPTPID
jgi:hypothetical protein